MYIQMICHVNRGLQECSKDRNLRRARHASRLAQSAFSPPSLCQHASSSGNLPRSLAKAVLQRLLPCSHPWRQQIEKLFNATYWRKLMQEISKAKEGPKAKERCSEKWSQTQWNSCYFNSVMMLDTGVPWSLHSSFCEIVYVNDAEPYKQYQLMHVQPFQ